MSLQVNGHGDHDLSSSESEAAGTAGVGEVDLERGKSGSELRARESSSPTGLAMAEGLKQVAESSRLGGVDLQWQNISYAITVKDKEGNSSKRVLLNKITGVVRKGELLAIMGPSGAGKTTLLNVLAGRASKRHHGKIMVDGAPVDKNTMSLFGYVRQEDTHFSYLSPREILTISARLRLPSSVSIKEKKDKVELIIRELGLSKCADTHVGTDMIKGISGGEKKRLSVGTELITDPSIIFLDEPTSGLDSHMALTLFDKLCTLKREIGRPIVSTIHQPSSKLLAKFDLLLLLSEGRTVYFGPASKAVDYFNGIGLHCPLYSNPCEFFLDVCSVHMGGKHALGDAEVDSGVDPSLDYLVERWEEEESGNLARLESVFASKKDVEDDEDSEDVVVHEPKRKVTRQYATSLWNQTMVLLWRSMLGFMRAKEMLVGQIGEAVIMGLLVGLVFLQVDNSQGGNNARQGGIFFMAMQMTFGPIMAQFSTFGAERNVVGHERDGKWYQVLPYFLGKSIAEIPMMIVVPFIYNLVAYWMIGLTPSAGNFFAFYGVLMLTYAAGSSLGLLVSAITPNFQLANVVGSVMLIFIILLSGYFLPDEDVPVFLRWIRAVSFLRYGFDLLMHIEYSSISSFYCTSSELTSNGTCPITTGQEALNEVGMGNVNVGLSLGIIVVLAVAYRICTYLAVRFYRPKV